jgi:uncharacterized protein (DUF427 family)
MIMSDHIKITPAEGTWVIRADGAILGESAEALELTEGSYPPVIYFPRKDFAMAFLDKSDQHSHCPYKGSASYYSIATASGQIRDAVWSYEDPKPGMEAIKGYLAFYPSKVTVEQTDV